MDKGFDTRLRQSCHWYRWRRIIPQNIQRNILVTLFFAVIAAIIIEG